MTEEKMRVEFKQDNMKGIMEKCLTDAEMRIDAGGIDFIIAEFPDNRKNIWEKMPTEQEIQVWISDPSMEQQIKDLMEKPYEELKPERLCGSMKQILQGTSSENAFCCMRDDIGGKGRPGSAGKYYLLIAVGVKKSLSGYLELFEYMVDTVKDRLNTVGEFWGMCRSDWGRQQLFGDMQKKWILFGKFAEYYMVKNNLPEPGILTQLSAARYEGSESEARIYFTKKAAERIEKFDDVGRDDRIIEEKNLRMIRKLMELSKRGQVYLYAENSTEEGSGKSIHTVSELVRCGDGKKQDNDTKQDTYVKFSGFMHWSLMMEGREVFSYYHGGYQFNVSEEKYAYINDIHKLKGFDQKQRKMIEKLVEILRKQIHGAVAVIFDKNTDASTEVERLCKKKRGTKICESICYQKRKGWNEEEILAVSAIDGALFIDHNGKCLAIGVIVDGEAAKEGNVGRGARYNSIANYVKLKPGRVGIVISEDGMTDVIQECPDEKPCAIQSVQNV